MLQRTHVVVHFACVVARVGRQALRLGENELPSRGDGPFNSARNNRFAPLKRSDEEVGVPQIPSGPLEAPERVVRDARVGSGLPVRRQPVGGQWVRNEGPGVLDGLDEAAGTVWGKGVRVHGVRYRTFILGWSAILFRQKVSQGKSLLYPCSTSRGIS